MMIRKEVNFKDIPDRLDPEPERMWDTLSDEQKAQLYAKKSDKDNILNEMALQRLGREPYLSSEELCKLIDEIGDD